MKTGYHALVKRLLDGELSLAELPPELQAEGEEALRLVGAADRAPVALSPALEGGGLPAAVAKPAPPAIAAGRWSTPPGGAGRRRGWEGGREGKGGDTGVG